MFILDITNNSFGLITTTEENNIYYTGKPIIEL